MELELSTGVRRLDCRSYNACLTFAFDEGWHGFSCNNCNAHDPISPTEWEADAEAIICKLLPKTYNKADAKKANADAG